MGKKRRDEAMTTEAHLIKALCSALGIDDYGVVGLAIVVRKKMAAEVRVTYKLSGDDAETLRSALMDDVYELRLLRAERVR